MSLSKALVFALQGLGDSLEATPLITAMRSAGVADQIDVCTTRVESRDLFAALDGIVDDVIYLPYWTDGLVGLGRSLLREAARRHYDVSLMAYPGARREYHMIARSFRARRRVVHGYDRPSIANGLTLYTDVVPIRPIHNVERNLDLLRATGYPCLVSNGSYVAPLHWIASEPRNMDRVAIHVGTVAHGGLESRRWPSEGFAGVGSRLADEGYEVVFVAGPAEAELTAAIVARDLRFKLWRASLGETARFLSTCGLVIANDNGIAHLSAAVGTPILALFGPTPLEHAPYGEVAHPYRPSTCAPCFDPRLLNTDCALGIGYRCIREEIRIGDVFAQAHAILNSAGIPNVAGT